MSELRTTRPTQTMASDKAGAKAAPTSKAATKPLSASKASKATKATSRAIVPAHKTKAGETGRCMVLMGTKRCSNPSRHEVTKGTFTCTTHGKRIAAGATNIRFVRTDVAYDPTLWGGPVPAPKSNAKASSSTKVTKTQASTETASNVAQPAE